MVFVVEVVVVFVVLYSTSVYVMYEVAIVVFEVVLVVVFVVLIGWTQSMFGQGHFDWQFILSFLKVKSSILIRYNLPHNLYSCDFRQ